MPSKMPSKMASQYRASFPEQPASWIQRLALDLAKTIDVEDPHACTLFSVHHF
jgi:hypothetical protein